MKRKETSASSALDTPPCSTPSSVTKSGNSAAAAVSAACALGMQMQQAAAELQPSGAYDFGFGSSAALSIAQPLAAADEPVAAVSIAGFSAFGVGAGEPNSTLLWPDSGLGVGGLAISLKHEHQLPPVSAHSSGGAPLPPVSAEFLQHLNELKPSLPLLALGAPPFASAMPLESQQQPAVGLMSPMPTHSTAAPQPLLYSANLQLQTGEPMQAPVVVNDGFSLIASCSQPPHESPPLIFSNPSAGPLSCGATQRANSTGTSPAAGIGTSCFTFASNANAADSSCGSLDAAPYSNSNAESVSAHSATSSQASSLFSQAASNGAPASNSDAAPAVSKGRIRVKRPRLVFTEAQRAELMEAFALNRRPTREQQENLARRLQLELATVANFFMNARRRNALPLATCASDCAKHTTVKASAHSPSTSDSSELHPPPPAALSDPHSVEAAAADLPFGHQDAQIIDNDGDDAKFFLRHGLSNDEADFDAPAVTAKHLVLPLAASAENDALPPDFIDTAACAIELVPPSDSMSMKDIKSERLLFGFAPPFGPLVAERDGLPGAPSPTSAAGPLASWV